MYTWFSNFLKTRSSDTAKSLYGLPGRLNWLLEQPAWPSHDLAKHGVIRRMP